MMFHDPQDHAGFGPESSRQPQRVHFLALLQRWQMQTERTLESQPVFVEVSIGKQFFKRM